VSEEEIALIVEQCRAQRGQDLDESLLEAPEAVYEPEDDEDAEFDPDEDPLLDKAIEIVVQTQTASVSLIQRRLRVGYTRAGRLIDMLERRGTVLNIAGFVGHSSIRTYVMGDDAARRAANDAEIAAMRRIVLDGMRAGEVLVLISNCPGVTDDIDAWTRSSDVHLVDRYETAPGEYEFYLSRQ